MNTHFRHLWISWLAALAGTLLGCSGNDQAGAPPADTCRAGGVGCACYGNGTCDGVLECNAGRCVATRCAPGERDCPCDAAKQCKPGLTCNPSGTCADATGHTGEACFPNQTCLQGGKCSNGQCVACEPGTLGCDCTAGAACGDRLTCKSTRCVTEGLNSIPAIPDCYTPCTDSFTDDAGFRACPDKDHLMPGCIGGNTCNGGTCSPPGSPPKACSVETDCADYQTCILGTCASTCGDDGIECGVDPATSCYRHVCRSTCSSDNPACPSGLECHLLEDERSGYCTPIVPAARDAGTDAPKGVGGSFSLSASSIVFGTGKLSSTVTITNTAPIAMTFTVRKVTPTPAVPALPWLSMGAAAGAPAPANVNQFTITVPASSSSAFSLVNDPTAVPPEYDGAVEVTNDSLGAQTVSVHYVAGVGGRWAGKVYYFAQFGEAGLPAYVANPSASAAQSGVGNAFVQQWIALRTGRIGLNEFNAILTSTTSESWRWPSVQSVCAGLGGAACYLYAPPSAGVGAAPGAQVYSTDLLAFPVPSGISDLPMAVDLQAGAGTTATGRIVSSEALQYADNPAISLSFASDPGSCPAGGNCPTLVPLSALTANVVVGGRYRTVDSDVSCANGNNFDLVKTPWLVPGFFGGTTLDSATGAHYGYECRDKSEPSPNAVDELLNVSLAGSNPVPDAQARTRRLQLVDGALVNQTSLYVIFKEQFSESFLGAGAPGFSAYGFMMLQRSPSPLPADAFTSVTNQVAPASPKPPIDLSSQAICSPSILTKVLGVTKIDKTTSAANIVTLAHALLDGVATPGSSAPYTSTQVHYLCADTGKLDNADLCPEGSGVLFFTALDPNGVDQAAGAASLSCNANGTCQQIYNQWVATPAKAALADTAWKCTTGNYCDSDRSDVRNGKTFYRPTQSNRPVFVPLLSQIADAFRYKTRFANRAGQNIGFAPSVCVPHSNAVPYCYDPPEIEAIRDRVDCLTTLFTNKDLYPLLDTATAQTIRSYLAVDFSYSNDIDPVVGPITHDGFEVLNAELQVMLGDDAYTSAFRSRFDLAGSSLVSFEGSKFEPGGIDLGGVAGYEMYTLYEATQYYQSVLDRFYRQGPALWSSVQNAAAKPQQSFIDQKAVVSYFDHVLRASSQKSRSWSEIGKRYQSFNRPDLARLVVQRAYISAYMESMILSRMMLSIVSGVPTEQRAQIQKAVETGMNTYRAAMLDMRETYAALTDQVNYFGFSADYIPFPALDPSGPPNAFAAVMATAQQALAVAKEKEDVAITGTRSFDTDSASFQSELTNLRINYENQLADLCGTFTGDDGKVYPAIPTYAALSAKTSALGDPCGLVGNGQLFEAVDKLAEVQVDVSKASNGISNVLTEVQIEKDRVVKECKLDASIADYNYTIDGQVNSLKSDINVAQQVVAGLERAKSVLQTSLTFEKCTVGTASDCPTGITANAVWLATSFALDAATAGKDVAVGNMQNQINDLQRSQAQWNTLAKCDAAQIDSNAKTKTTMLQLKGFELDGIKARYEVRDALAGIQKLRNQATRLMSEEQESQQLAINVQAAKNDPNARIYKNDAILNAERTFYLAATEAYKATRLFEYYTSQSYAKLTELSLVRLVSRGDYNLENYLSELSQAYETFQDTYGKPDVRVLVLSLRDDILRIPLLGEDGTGASQVARDQQFHAEMRDPHRLDGHGYLTIPFQTVQDQISPVTRNHKILYVEAELTTAQTHGGDMPLLYLKQSGTGVVMPLTGLPDYYRLPPRTAAITPFEGAVKTLDPAVYRNDRLRDRPLLNTDWELQINLVDEPANKGLDLDAVSDLKLYVYYTDFTAL